MTVPLTPEQVSAIRSDANLNLKILKGDRFEQLRQVAGSTLQALEDRDRLVKALRHLLDDYERTAAGFPQHVEVRYAVRDGARAALESVGVKP